MIEFICRYYNNNEDTLVVVYDVSAETVLIVNETTLKTTAITEMKNMSLDMFCFIADDFSELAEINKHIVEPYEEDIEYIQENCKDGAKFVEALKENDIEIK